MEYQSEERGFWGPGTIAAGIILLLVIIAGGALVVLRTTGGSSAGQPSASQPVPGGGGGPSTTTGGSGGNGCSVPAGSQTVPQTTPDGISWSIYGTVALPVSKSAGPKNISGNVARCYSHDPVGALVAATQISARIVLSPTTDVAKEQAVPGPGQTAFIAQDVPTPGGNTVGSFAQMAAFKYVTYSPSTAVVELVTQGTSGAYQASTVTVQWTDNDWKLVLQPNGATTPSLLPVTSIVGYATWAGV